MGTPSDPLATPVHDRMVYLGVVVSYHQFEMQTLQHRMKVANMQKHRLVKVLRSARALSLNHWIRVYFACVRSTTMYGLRAGGVAPRVAAHLSSFEIRRLRALARSSVRTTRESNEQLLQRLGVTSSLDYLSKMLEKRMERVDVQTAEWFTLKMGELNACRAVPTQEDDDPAGEGVLLPLRRRALRAACVSQT